MPNCSCKRGTKVTTLAVANHFLNIAILAAFSDLDPLLQALEVLVVLTMVAIIGFKGWRWALKRRNRDKIWLIYR